MMLETAQWGLEQVGGLELVGDLELVGQSPVPTGAEMKARLREKYVYSYYFRQLSSTDTITSLDLRTFYYDMSLYVEYHAYSLQVSMLTQASSRKKLPAPETVE